MICALFLWLFWCVGECVHAFDGRCRCCCCCSALGLGVQCFVAGGVGLLYYSFVVVFCVRYLLFAAACFGYTKVQR